MELSNKFKEGKTKTEMRKEKKRQNEKKNRSVTAGRPAHEGVRCVEEVPKKKGGKRRVLPGFEPWSAV